MQFWGQKHAQRDSTSMRRSCSHHVLTACYYTFKKKLVQWRQTDNFHHWLAHSGFSSSQIVPFLEQQQDIKKIFTDEQWRKNEAAGMLICMHPCFCSDCEKATGIWQHGLSEYLIWPDMLMKELLSGCLPSWFSYEIGRLDRRRQRQAEGKHSGWKPERTHHV